MRMSAAELASPMNRRPDGTQRDERDKEYWNGAYRYEPYPKMLYKAWQRADGKIVVHDHEDTVAGHITVNSEREHAEKKAQGYHESPVAAMAAYGREQEVMANAAAEKHFADQRMSELSQREAARDDAATGFHVTDPKAEPELVKVRNKPGRKPKVAVAEPEPA